MGQYRAKLDRSAINYLKSVTTIPKGSTSQANGDGNGGLLIEKSKDEDIV